MSQTRKSKHVYKRKGVKDEERRKIALVLSTMQEPVMHKTLALNPLLKDIKPTSVYMHLRGMAGRKEIVAKRLTKAGPMFYSAKPEAAKPTRTVVPLASNGAKPHRPEPKAEPRMSAPNSFFIISDNQLFLELEGLRLPLRVE